MVVSFCLDQVGISNVLALKGAGTRHLLQRRPQFLKQQVFGQQDPLTRFPQGTFAASA